MATISREEAGKSFNSRLSINTPVRCALQCIKEEYKVSGKGNMMVAREWQILQHAELKIDGTPIDLTGNEINEYMTLKWSDGKEGFLPKEDSKVKKGIERAYDKLDAFGFGKDELIDVDNPKLEMTGKVIDAMINTQEKDSTHPPTAEELSQGIKIGQPKLDEDGKPLKFNVLNLQFFCGPSKVEPKAF